MITITTLPTLTVELIFLLKSITDYVHLGYCRYSFKAFTPSVLQCFKCRRLGYYGSKCRGKQRCASCEEDHTTADCTVTCQRFVCMCGESHSSAYDGGLAYREAKYAVTLACNSRESG